MAELLKKKVAIVTAKFNSIITRELESAAIEKLQEEGLAYDSIDVYQVPGAFELPFICKKTIESKKYHGIIAIACIIEGETPHFNFVAGECAKGIQKVMLDYGLPVIFCVLTTNNTEQALNRAGLKFGNKGAEAAMSLIQVWKTLFQISK